MNESDDHNRRPVQFPGLYYDAVYVDYLAAIGAFLGDMDNFTPIIRHNGLPLLGNFYYGTITAAVQWIILKITGYASVGTLRVGNLGYIAIIGCLIYLMTRNILRKKIIPAVFAIFGVSTQNSLIILRTQYYIMLPGCILFLLSIVFLIRGIRINKMGKGKNLLLAGIFQGLAFYGYFDSLVTNILGYSGFAKLILLIGVFIILFVLEMPAYTLTTANSPKWKK